MSDKLTPMMRQYRRIRRELPEGTILFFRMGDFYEMFFEEAQEVARLLDIALTKRQNVPMCGVPHHAMEGYLARLVKAGRKVAVCEQVEDPATAKGIVKREVVRIETPGTVTSDAVLESNRNNYLAALVHEKSGYGLAFFDLSTGEFWVESAETAAAASDVISRIGPNECIVPAALLETAPVREVTGGFRDARMTEGEDWTFDYETARDTLVRHFHVHSLEGFGCEERVELVRAAGGVLYYVREELRRSVSHVRSLRVRNPEAYLILDETTCDNLDLVPVRGGSSASTLLGALDVTSTPMGGRLLRDRLLRPSAELSEITARHDAVETMTRDRTLLRDVRDALRDIRDLERVIARLASGGGNARDMRSIGQSLNAMPGLRRLIADCSTSRLVRIHKDIDEFGELSDLIGRTIVEEPPMTIKEGGIIREGYHSELDTLRDAATQGRRWLAEYQAEEQKRTGIKTIKVRHNKVFGYYIEVSKGQSANVPDNYERKQTLVNAERYITPKLKEYEQQITGAQERSMALEYDLFLELRTRVVEETEAIQRTAQAVAELDVLTSFADRALALRYVRPRMTDGETISIRDGRHPVIEEMPDSERFVPNDALLNRSDTQLVIITGPNMAGKSTFIRQVALIAVMAHAGSFVPASEAEICLVDRVFTRVGASDDLARGRSTFMVEMQETANILNNATARSLIVLDEIGRGTSTFDGISIAWAVAEYLHNTDAVKAKTLFATHYHELTDLTRELPGVKNYNVLVREKNDQVVFLRKIVPGGADKSYGIQVARLAGLPLEVVERAKEILSNLEEGELSESGHAKIAKRRRRRKDGDPAQMSLFGGEAPE